MQITTQSVSDIAAPLFRGITQIGNDGTFEVEIEVPGQPGDVKPVSVKDDRRLYTVRLYVDGELAAERDYPEGSIQKPAINYSSNKKAIVLGSVVDGNGTESDVQECRYVIRFIADGYVVGFDSCGNATLSDCTIEGNDGGVLVSSSSLMVLDCEIILDGDDFISKDSSSYVLEQNVRKTTR